MDMSSLVRPHQGRLIAGVCAGDRGPLRVQRHPHPHPDGRGDRLLRGVDRDLPAAVDPYPLRPLTRRSLPAPMSHATREDGGMSNVLERFGPATQDWFRGAFAEPTPAQLGAWDAISHGRHALVVAPTGSGKTLSAFLWAIDRVFREKDAAPPAAAGNRAPAARRRAVETASPTRILYISPLKALGVDVERNLRSPLVGIGQSARRLGITVPGVTVGVRSGDTTSSDRRKLVAAPPDILITTPESLYLMLTSQAGETLKHVHTVIIDEVHAVAATKRGAHLAVSLERLDALLETAGPAHRPVGDGAPDRRGRPVPRAAPRRSRSWRRVQPRRSTSRSSCPSTTCSTRRPRPVPRSKPATRTRRGDRGTESRRGLVRRRRRLAASPSPESTEATGSLWPHVEEAIVDRILQHRSTIVFSNSRRLAERLTGRLNEIYAERFGLDVPDRRSPRRCGPPQQRLRAARMRRLEELPGRLRPVSARERTRCSRRPTTGRSRRSSARRSRRS